MATAPGDAFDEERLLRSARRSAGSEDFGSEPFLEPLQVLLDSLRSAPLNDLGAMIMRGTLLRSLIQRLRAEQWWTAHPEILDEPIERADRRRRHDAVGHDAAAAGPGQRPAPRVRLRLGGGRAVAPCRAGIPPHADPRIADAEAREEQMRTFAAELFAIHPTYVHEAEEEIVFLADAFLSHIPEASCDVPALPVLGRRRRTSRPAYRWLRRMLQLLQWQKRQRGEPVRPFVLKTPGPPRLPRRRCWPSSPTPTSCTPTATRST